MEHHFIFPLITRFNNPDFVMKLKLKRAIRFLSSHSKNNEWNNAVEWYSMKKNEIKSKFNKSGQRLVNEEFIEDHVSGKTDEMSNRLFMGGY